MPGFSFVHAADLHLDSPFAGLQNIQPDLQDRLQQSTFATLQNIVDLCLAEEVDFLLLAGDVYDQADRSLKAQIALQRACEQLAGAGIPVYIVHGNHDHLGGWRADLTWPESVHFFPADRVEAAPVKKNGQLLATICGISYSQQAVTRPLAREFPSPAKDTFSIGLLHANVGGDPAHDNYAPCPLEDLIQSGFDYWALGHIHSRRILQEASPVVSYPGNTQGRNPQETGPRGCYLVRVNGGQCQLTFIPVDDVRWQTVTLSIENYNSIQELLSDLQEPGRLLEPDNDRATLIRCILTGRGRLHKELHRTGILNDLLEEAREGTESFSGRFTWVESIQLRTGPAVDRASLLKDTSFLADFLTLLDQAKEDPNLKEEMKGALSELYGHHLARRWLREPEDEELQAMLQEVENLGLDLLMEDQQ